MADTEQKPVEQNQPQVQQPVAPAQTEQPVKETATQEKQQYTFTEEGVVIEATSLEDAVKQLNENKKEQK